jgi:SAM-dependent methyltransferase
MLDTAALTDHIIENTPFRRNVYDMIPEGASSILDFGSGAGGLILRLKRDKGCTDLHALEINREDAIRLAPLVDHVWCLDYEKGQTLPPEYKGYFKYVILHDVVEHLFDPWVTLSRIRELLADDGLMIVSTPNILYWMLQYDILRGRFHYGPGFWHTGHLRWYTPASLAELLVIAGLKTERFYLDIPEKVSFLRLAQSKEIRQVSFPPEELAARYPDKPPITVSYPQDIRKSYPVFFAGKLIAVCSKTALPFELTYVTYNCPYLDAMRKKLDMDTDLYAPFEMIPLIGTSH